jgi:hydroxymethylpyrimidine pyrophosphatase-like HAD family hydrolase
MFIAIDFDGTIVTHQYPRIGTPVPYAFESMKLMQQLGINLILYTMRSGKELQEAVDYCEFKGIQFYAVNENPTQYKWTQSNKVFAHMYIDDMAYGAPLLPIYEERLFFDWSKLYFTLGDIVQGKKTIDNLFGYQA